MPKSKFLMVECSACSNTQVVYSHSSRTVKCQVCGEVLAEPKGGKARIRGKLVIDYGH